MHTANTVLIGLLDTGVDTEHPALQGRIAAYCSFVDEGDAAPVYPGGPSGHGTQLAGLMCGKSFRDFAGGAAPRARLVVAEVIGRQVDVGRMLRGLDWVLQQGVRIVCMPFGLPHPNAAFDSRIALMHRRGILPVAAVGNGGAGRALSPSTHPQVLAVGAADEHGSPARFTASFNPRGHVSCEKPDLLAPGVEVRTPAPGGGTAVCSGTSVAAAIVAGTAAGLWQQFPHASMEVVAEALKRTSLPVEAAQTHRCARGIMRPEAARDALANSNGGHMH